MCNLPENGGCMISFARNASDSLPLFTSSWIIKREKIRAYINLKNAHKHTPLC